VDAKGPLACFAAAGAKAVPPPGWRVTVVGAVGEESDSRGALFLRERYHPAFLIIGEPSKWDRITLGFKGSLGVEYSVCKETAHTASGRQSAPEAAVEFWNGLKAWCDSLNSPESGAFAQLTPTLKSMDSRSDGFTETASLKIGLRLPPGIEPVKVIEKLDALRGEGEVRCEDPLPAFRSDKNNPLVRAFLNAIRGQGGTPVFSLKTGTSDMNLVAPAWGCPAVAYGPGDSTLDHTPGEHVSLSEYFLSIEVLKNVLDLLVK
jgi:LysW-gamma-L-lysine carboxypeptidase